MFLSPLRRRQGLAQLQTVALISSVALVGSAGFLAFGESAEQTVTGSATSGSAASRAPVIGSRSEAAGFWVRLGRRALAILDEMDPAKMGLYVGEQAMQEAAVRRAARATTKTETPPTVTNVAVTNVAVTNVAPPKAVAGAPEALVANWRGPTGGPTDNMRYFEGRALYRTSEMLDDGTVEYQYVFPRENLQDHIDAPNAKVALGRLTRIADERGAVLFADGDKLRVSLREKVGLSDKFAAQTRLRALAHSVKYDAPHRYETLRLAVDTTDPEQVARYRALLTRAGANYVYDAPGELLVDIKPQAPRSAADRMLAQLIVEHGAEIGVNRNGQLYAQLPRAGVSGESVRGLTRSDQTIRAGFVKASEAPELYPELAGEPISPARAAVLAAGRDLAWPTKPYRFTFTGIDTFDL